MLFGRVVGRRVPCSPVHTGNQFVFIIKVFTFVQTGLLNEGIEGNSEHIVAPPDHFKKEGILIAVVELFIVNQHNNISLFFIAVLQTVLYGLSENKLVPIGWIYCFPLPQSVLLQSFCQLLNTICYPV